MRFNASGKEDWINEISNMFGGPNAETDYNTPQGKDIYSSLVDTSSNADIGNLNPLDKSKLLYDTAVDLAQHDQNGESTTSEDMEKKIDYHFKNLTDKALENGTLNPEEAKEGWEIRSAINPAMNAVKNNPVTGAIKAVNEDLIGNALAEGGKGLTKGLGALSNWWQGSDEATPLSNQIEDWGNKVFTKENMAMVPSIAEDVGLMALNGVVPGLGVGLTVAKNVAEQGSNLAEAMSDRDLTTGLKKTGADQAGQFAGAALPVALSVLPAVGKPIGNAIKAAAKGGGKVAAKGAEEALAKGGAEALAEAAEKTGAEKTGAEALAKAAEKTGAESLAEAAEKTGAEAIGKGAGEALAEAAEKTGAEAAEKTGAEAAEKTGAESLAEAAEKNWYRSYPQVAAAEAREGLKSSLSDSMNKIKGNGKKVITKEEAEAVAEGEKQATKEPVAEATEKKITPEQIEEAYEEGVGKKKKRGIPPNISEAFEGVGKEYLQRPLKIREAFNNIRGRSSVNGDEALRALNEKVEGDTAKKAAAYELSEEEKAMMGGGKESRLSKMFGNKAKANLTSDANVDTLENSLKTLAEGGELSEAENNVVKSFYQTAFPNASEEAIAENIKTFAGKGADSDALKSLQKHIDALRKNQTIDSKTGKVIEGSYKTEKQLGNSPLGKFNQAINGGETYNLKGGKLGNIAKKALTPAAVVLSEDALNQDTSAGQNMLPLLAAMALTRGGKRLGSRVLANTPGLSNVGKMSASSGRAYNTMALGAAMDAANRREGIAKRKDDDYSHLGQAMKNRADAYKERRRK